MNFQYLKGKIRFVSPIAYISNAIAFVLLGFFAVILWVINIQSTMVMMVGMFSAFSMVTQTYFLKIRKMQESDWVDKKWLKKVHKLKTAQLDTYAKFDYLLFTLIKALVVLTMCFGSSMGASKSRFFICTLFLGGFAVRKWLGMQAIIPFPAGFLRSLHKGLNYSRRRGWYELDTANQLGSGITSYKWRDM